MTTLFICMAPGTVAIDMENETVIRVRFIKEPSEHHVSEDSPPQQEVIRQLTSYFSGELRQFTCLVRLTGTPFQLSVYQALMNVPAGAVVSYRKLAQMAHHPFAWRAVGTTLKHNPLPIFIPCHRVIPKAGTLGSYQGGADWKRWLLALEGIHL